MMVKLFTSIQVDGQFLFPDDIAPIKEQFFIPRNYQYSFFGINQIIAIRPNEIILKCNFIKPFY